MRLSEWIYLEGYNEGYKEGYEIGFRIARAERMLKDSVPVEIISRFTGISVIQIKRIALSISRRQVVQKNNLREE